MAQVVRSILAVFAGFVAASVVMLVVESINGRVLYPELGRAAAGLTDPETIKAVMASAPVGAFLVVALGWVLGGVAGGFVAARIGRHAPVGLALVLGVCLTLAGVANNLMLPPPAWFWLVTLVVFIPATNAGARLAARK